jgi:transcriptional regulator with GAF, ATPase, and Fis domain
MPSSSSLIEQKLIVANALFAFSKSILRYEQFESAIGDVMSTLMRVVQGKRYAICGRDRSDIALRYIAVGNADEDQSTEKTLIGQEVRIGSMPCGLALEADEFVQKAIGDEILLEIPAKHARFIAYVLSLRCSYRTDSELLNLAASSLKNAAQLLEEFLTLRARLAEKMELERGRESREAYSNAEESVVSWHGIVGNSGPMREMFGMLEKVANTDASVLLLGESGTGKELIAQAIHQKSHRAGAPFIAVNCAALPESVIESELFGHEKGSFTGAYDQRKGRFELANNGTLFLDEIGELSPTTQIKLLRFLQNHRFERVGGNASIEANVRVIAATNRNLQEAVDRGSFRADLYYRLNVFPIEMAPLRERVEDIPLLMNEVISRM